jgi:hypothetical protein
MINLIKKYLIQIIFLLAIVLILLLRYGLDLTLSSIEEIFNIIGSSSISIALATYVYTKEQNQTSEAIDQVAFFRSQILPFINATNELIEKNFPGKSLQQIRLSSRDGDYLRKHYGKEIKIQLEWFDFQLKDGSRPIRNNQIDLLNRMEEFALRIKHSRTKSHRALSATKGAFCTTIEKNAMALILEREALSQPDNYSASLELYDFWIKDVDDTPQEERIKKFQKEWIGNR